ncbi:MAG: hypothetical protein ACREYE_08565 [Gammaproteobacteria bacterium]
MTTKSSICAWGVLYKSGLSRTDSTVSLRQAQDRLTLGGLLGALGSRVREKLAGSMLTAEEKPVLSQSKGQQRV